MSSTAGSPARLLVVEDERKVADALQRWLASGGYDVVLALTGEEGWSRATTEPFDLIILDVMLPGRDGLEILTGLRHRGAQTPVLILTARDALEDRVLGLDSGADDYLVKPFALPELLARVRALLRRSHTTDLTELRCADLQLDRIARTVIRGGHVVNLAPREFDLLEYLLRHRGQLVSREMLARDVWKEPSRATPLDNVIDVHMTRLRKKIDADFAIRLIHTIRGVGFMLHEEAP
jgi:two-component system copper resistance phosphate regulon response regulator CusR